MINQTGELIVYQIVLVPRYEDIYHSAGKCDCGPLHYFLTLFSFRLIRSLSASRFNNIFAPIRASAVIRNCLKNPKLPYSGAYKYKGLRSENIIFLYLTPFHYLHSKYLLIQCVTDNMSNRQFTLFLFNGRS